MTSRFNENFFGDTMTKSGSGQPPCFLLRKNTDYFTDLQYFQLNNVKKKQME